MDLGSMVLVDQGLVNRPCVTSRTLTSNHPMALPWARDCGCQVTARNIIYQCKDYMFKLIYGFIKVGIFKIRGFCTKGS